MGLELKYEDGQTPLSEEEKDELIRQAKILGITMRLMGEVPKARIASIC